ncbi:MlaD family protein [Salinisphaera orenii]|uniref:MlaD family protein n=1 Tax=Salinisphaera orenii TaxID=856731 RepID=UPI000DBE571E
MASNRTYAMVGAFLVGALILTALGVLIFGGAQLFSQKRQAVVFFNQSVLGLSKGGRVLFRGVKVGTVQQVQVRVDPETDHARIAVKISVTDKAAGLNGKDRAANPSIEKLVKNGLRAQLVVYSYVTSELAVNLSFKPDTSIAYAVSPDRVSLPQIPATQSQISKVKNKVVDLPWKKTIKRLNTTMKSLINLSNDLDETVNQIGPSLQKTTTSTQKTLQSMRQAVQDNNEQLQSTIKQVQQLSRNANKVTKTADKQLSARGQQLDQVLANAHKTTKQLNQLTKNVNSLVAPGKSSRADIKNILRDLSASAANLRDFTETIERKPNTLIYGDSR